MYCVSALTPSAAGMSSAETMLVEEERTERRMAAEQNHQQQQSIQPLMTSLQTDQHQMSSLSPAVSVRIFLNIIFSLTFIYLTHSSHCL